MLSPKTKQRCPRNETKHLAYFNGSNVKVSGMTRRIIELYGNKKSGPEYVKLRCSHCGRH